MHIKKRAAIEPIIGHIKVWNSLNRSFYNGVMGDEIKSMLAASG